MRYSNLAAIAAILIAAPVAAQTRETPMLAIKSDPADARVLVTLPAPDAQGIAGRFIHVAALRSGLGSAEIALDRGQLGPEQILAFRRYGKKVAVTFENTRFRATGDAGTERGARESFAFSIVAMLDIVSTASDGALTVDLAPFLTRDILGVADALNGTGSGADLAIGGRAGKGFKLAGDLSTVDPTSIKAFPDNIEIDAVQTYASDTPGREVSSIAPEARQVSFVVHHSFIRLPAPGFVTRRLDIRSGAFGTGHYDYGSPLGTPVLQEVANRFRLEKVDPAAARSRVKKAIVFYIDPAAPEPIRTALREGVDFWKAAFEAAGLIDAFRAEILPAGADPMDVRYNMVNWSNRLTRGWSYGGGITDPRTGEIIKGNVVIGALRVRQDMIIFEGLVGTAGNGSGGPQDPVRASLDRIRQLGAHEVGHALGFAHNFAASTQDRGSVMDYPGPRVKLTGGQIDLSDAYAPGIGAWDRYAVDWLYADPAPSSDPDAAAAAKARAAAGLRYASDGDGRSVDAANPYGSMWDDGDDPFAHLGHMLAVRRVALGRFGPQVLRAGEPLSDLRRKFVPVWLFHRYAVDAAAKLIGGIDYRYAVAGDATPPPAPVPAATQLAALDALVGTLSPEALTVPAGLVPMLSSASNARSDPQYNQEVLRTAAGPAFDPLVAADVAAQLPLDALLAPARAARLVEQHRRDAALPGLETVLDRLETRVLARTADPVARRIAWRAAMTMAATARDPAASPEVAAAVGDRLTRLGTQFRAAGGTGEEAAWRRHLGTILGDPERLKAELDKRQAKPTIPPGMPIESDWFGL
ncbi:zinc-dependent metalloprotease [Sphingomonas sp. Y38-1Y]|uniref:zinc-dependent metalloprotease n=1 Tax=Sphingomonas sp. Y38-1Y TaxID=3078265 RepID=UPI0028E3039B|nr:zinc-dependent metalloprotease [Sphingomonas sp. Y38-1Y]